MEFERMVVAKCLFRPPPRAKGAHPKHGATNFVKRGRVGFGQMRLKVNEREDLCAAWAEVLIYLMLGNGLGVDPDGLARMTASDMLVPFLLGRKSQIAMGTGQLIGFEAVQSTSMALNGGLRE